jgi:D-lyxose ketol-isomerase
MWAFQWFFGSSCPNTTIVKRKFSNKEILMKRSEINSIIRDADQFIENKSFHLPPFAHWSPNEWKGRGKEALEIVRNNLGWDITDFGSGNYERVGLFLFTIRNGSAEEMRSRSGKLYCEKIMIVGVGQVTPMHFHANKVEDIINRGGGKLVIKLYNSSLDSGLADTDVTVSVDGIKRIVKAGSEIILDAGESITLPPRLYHEFWGTGERVLVGEVSLVNDDTSDNCFLNPVGRFPKVEEDEEPYRLLVTDYSKYYRFAGSA